MDAVQLVSEGAARLEAAGVPEARIKAEWWVSEVLGVRRDELPGVTVDDRQYKTIASGLVRLEQHEPLQYVIGHTPFLDVDLITDARALVPRPETEELVSLVLACDKLWSQAEVNIADVGTGSGCIAIALACSRPNARVIATDTSPDALALAGESAKRNDVAGRIDFRSADLLEGIARGTLDAVISNPPYVATREIEGLECSVREFEPVAALDGGADGLDAIRRLVPQAFTVLSKGGRLWLEIGDEQGEAVRGLLEEAGFLDAQIRRDMYGQERFAEGIKQ